MGLRGKKIGSTLVRLCLDKMREMGADECVLETEVTNKGALGLYRNMGFVKEKRLHKYYLNGNDAFRLKFLFNLPEGFEQGHGCLGPPAAGQGGGAQLPHPQEDDGQQGAQLLQPQEQEEHHAEEDGNGDPQEA